MTGWWRRNTIALGAAAVLLPATVLVVGGNEWLGYFSGRPVLAIDANAEGVVEHAGATWGPVKSAIAENTEGLTVPPGAQVIIAQIRVDPKSKPVTCLAPLLVEQSTGRQWSQMRLELGLPWDSAEPTECVGTSTDSYDIFVPFIVPADAEGPYWVEIDTFTNPEFVRFTIDP